MDLATKLNRHASQRNEPLDQTGCRKQDNWLVVTRSIRDGDSDAFEQLYNEFFDSVYRIIRMLAGRDEPTSLDIAQAVWMKVIRSIKPIDNRRQLASWLHAVTRTVTYDWLRKEVRRNHKHQQWSATSDSPEANAPSTPQHAVDDRARIIWLEQQLAQIPADTRSMIDLKYRLGWSLRRIGNAFGLKTGAVDGRIRRAVEQLRRQAATNETLID